MHGVDEYSIHHKPESLQQMGYSNIRYQKAVGSIANFT